MRISSSRSADISMLLMKIAPSLSMLMMISMRERCLSACASAVGVANGLFIFFRLREQWIAWYVCAALEAVINVISGYVMQRKIVDVHSVMNKMTGGVLFVLPLAVSVIDPVFSVSVVCLVATFAAFQENRYIIRYGMEGKTAL